MPIYIYGLKCPLAGTIRYIGKSKTPQKRFRCHVDHAKTYRTDHHTARWIRSLLNAELLPELVIIREVSDTEKWQDVEREFIANAERDGWKLTNSTAGGEGLDYIDPIARAKYRANISAAMKELWNRPERRIEARQRSLKAWADPEITARRLESLRRAHATPEVRKQFDKIRAEMHASPEVQARRTESIKASWQDPVKSLKRRNALASTETRAKMSERAKARWADANKSAALMEVFARPESRQKRSASARLRATHKYRTMMAAKTKASWNKRRKT